MVGCWIKWWLIGGCGKGLHRIRSTSLCGSLAGRAALAIFGSTVSGVEELLGFAGP